MAQPWSVIGSYLLSCVVGLLCAAGIAQPQLGAALAVASSIWMMHRFHCIHPPGAAMGLFLALDGPRSLDANLQLASQLGLDVAMVLLSTMLVSKFVLRRPYPYTAPVASLSAHRTRDAAPMRLTLVNGVPTFENGVFTQALPGEMLSPVV